MLIPIWNEFHSKVVFDSSLQLNLPLDLLWSLLGHSVFVGNTRRLVICSPWNSFEYLRRLKLDSKNRKPYYFHQWGILYVALEKCVKGNVRKS